MRKRRGVAIFLFMVGLVVGVGGLAMVLAGMGMRQHSASDPKDITMLEYQKQKPPDVWLRLGCCQLTSGYMYTCRRGGKNGKIDYLLIPIWDSGQLERASRQEENAQNVARGGRSIPSLAGPGYKGLKTCLLLRVDDPPILQCLEDESHAPPKRTAYGFNMEPSKLDLMLSQNGYQGKAIEVLEGRLEKDGLTPDERKDLVNTSEGLVEPDFKVFRKGRPWKHSEAYTAILFGLALTGLGFHWINASRAA